MRKIQSITIIATEWLDKVNGNSYFSAEVLVDGLRSLHIPFTYGYDNHYSDVCCKELVEAGYLPASAQPISLWEHSQTMGFALTSHKVRVGRKRDMI